MEKNERNEKRQHGVDEGQEGDGEKIENLDENQDIN